MWKVTVVKVKVCAEKDRASHQKAGRIRAAAKGDRVPSSSGVPLTVSGSALRLPRVPRRSTA